MELFAKRLLVVMIESFCSLLIGDKKRDTVNLLRKYLPFKSYSFQDSIDADVWKSTVCVCSSQTDVKVPSGDVYS